MGVLGVSIGKVQEALPFFKTALEANPNMSQFWLSYIDTLIKLDCLFWLVQLVTEVELNASVTAFL